MYKWLWLFYYYLLFNGLVLFVIGIFRVKKNPATWYFFLQYIILLLLVTEFITTADIFRRFSFWCYSDFPIRFLLTPFVYFYVCTYTNPGYKPSARIKWLLFLPAILELLCFAVISLHYYNHPHSFEERLRIANTSVYYYVRTFLSLLFNLGCIVFSYRKLTSFSWSIVKVLSSLRKLKFNWLKIILGIAIVLWIFWLINFVFEVFFMDVLPVPTLYFVLYFLIALVMLVFGYFAVLKPYVPEAYIQATENIMAVSARVEEKSLPEKALHTNAPAQKEVAEPENVFKNYFIQLEEYISSTQIFREPDITLVQIAKSLNTTSFNISKAIKIYSKEGSFYEYVNRLRLIYFLQLLQKAESNRYTINTLSLQAGFTSATTLNKYCRKITGTTAARAKSLLEKGSTVEDLLHN